jgi:hypothetical protein
MLWKILTTLGVPESLIEMLKICTRMLRSTSELVRNLNSFSRQAEQGDNLAPVLFIFVIHAVSNTLDKKWDFTTPDFRWFPDTQEASREDNYAEPITFDVLVWLFTLEVREKAKTRKRRPFTFRGLDRNHRLLWRTSKSPTAVLLHQVQILRILLVPELNDTADITERISQARKLFGSMNKQLLGNKRYRSISVAGSIAIVVNIALWGSERHWKKQRSKLEAFHHGCLRKMCGLTMWDVAEKRITNEHVRGMVANSPTMDTLMETRRCRWLSKLSAMEESRSPRRMLGMVYDGKTSRETSADHTTRLHNVPQEARLWRERAAKGMDDRR